MLITPFSAPLQTQGQSIPIGISNMFHCFFPLRLGCTAESERHPQALQGKVLRDINDVVQCRISLT